MTGKFPKVGQSHRTSFRYYLNFPGLSENECGSRLADEGGRLGRLILAVDAVHDRYPVGHEAGFTVQPALKC